MSTQELIERLKARASQQPDSILGLLMAEAAAELEALRGKLAGVDEKALEVADRAALSVMMSHNPSITPETRHQKARHAAIAAYLAAVRDKG